MPKAKLFNDRRFKEAMAEVGTPLWAERCRRAMQDAMNKERSAIIDFKDEWSEFIGNRGWELLADDKEKKFLDYRSFALCKRPHGLGMDSGDFVRHCEAAQQATGIDPRDRAQTAKPLNGHGNLTGENNSRRKSKAKPDSDNHVMSVGKQGNRSEYLTARIARDRPDILDRMKAGEFKSVRKAAIEAGIVKVPTVLESAKKAFLKLNDVERMAFLDWVDHDLQEDAA